MDETMPAERRGRGRNRSAAGFLAAGLVVLVGCATIDGRAAVGEGAIAEPSTTSAGPTAGSPRSSNSSTGDPTSGSTDLQTSGDPDTPTSESSSTISGPTTTSATSPEPGPAPTPNSASTSPPGPAEPTDAAGDQGDQPLTAPGTALPFGAPARLPFTYADAEGVFTVNGLTVTRGSEADWAALGVDTAEAQGEEPWFLRMSLTQESGGDFAITAVQDDLWAYTADGDSVFVMYPDDEENGLCPTTYAPDGFTVGDSYDTCVVLSVNLGESVDRVQFEGGFDADDPYFENPVVWKN